MNVLKSTSSSYVQNMIENKVLMSYLHGCFLLVMMTPDSGLFLKYCTIDLSRILFGN